MFNPKISRRPEESHEAKRSCRKTSICEKTPKWGRILRFDTTGSRDSWKRCQNDWDKIPGCRCTPHRKALYSANTWYEKQRECQDLDDTIAELYRTNPRLREAGVQILSATFQKSALINKKSAGGLLITFGEPERANKMVRQEIIWRYLAHICELFEGYVKPTQCFKCHGFGHMGIHCRQTERCGYCSRTGHKPEDRSWKPAQQIAVKGSFW